MMDIPSKGTLGGLEASWTPHRPSVIHRLYDNQIHNKAGWGSRPHTNRTDTQKGEVLLICEKEHRKRRAAGSLNRLTSQRL
mgnify:CR=1 FL=1